MVASDNFQVIGEEGIYKKIVLQKQSDLSSAKGTLIAFAIDADPSTTIALGYDSSVVKVCSNQCRREFV